MRRVAEDWAICRMAACSCTSRGNEGARFLEDFKHNIQVTEENRAVFVHTVRNSIANPPIRNE
jgi:hypothetical protein